MPSAIYSLMCYAEKAVAAHPERKPALFEEIAWGCDYFRKIVNDRGMVYDCQFTPIGYGPRDYYDWSTPLGSHYNVARMLARAARILRADDPVRSEKYLETAKRIYGYTLSAPEFDTPWHEMVDNLPRGTQKANFYTQSYRGSATSLAGKACLELDLFLTTGEEAYARVARTTIREFIGLQVGDGPLAGMFREAAGKPGAGLLSCEYLTNNAGALALVKFIRALPDVPETDLCKRALRLYADHSRRLLDRANYDYLPKIQGDGVNTPKSKDAVAVADGFYVNNTSSSLAWAGHLAVLFDAAADFLGEPSYRPYAQRCFDWAFGLNGDESSYIVGVGYTKYESPVFGQFFPSTPYLPGAVFHVRAGEYDMPATGMVLLAIAERM